AVELRVTATRAGHGAEPARADVRHRGQHAAGGQQLAGVAFVAAALGTEESRLVGNRHTAVEACAMRGDGRIVRVARALAADADILRFRRLEAACRAGPSGLDHGMPS